MTAFLFVLAAAVGTLLRHLAHERLPQVPLPIGILAVNLAGSFLLGLLAGWDPPGATIVGTAGLGALTTFSTFTAQAVSLGSEGRRRAVVYVAISVFGGVLLAWCGLRLA